MKCAVNSNRSLLEAPIDVHTNNICCNDPECVLPSCINEKLQNMNTIINKAKPKKERKQKKRNNDHLWDQDLDDILNIFPFNNSGNTCNDPFTTHATNEIETGEKLVHKRKVPSSRNDFSDPSPLFGNTSACQTALSPGNDWQLMNLAPTQSTPTSEVTFSTEETLLLGGAMSTFLSSTSDIVGNIIQPVDSLSCIESDQYTDFAVFAAEASPSSMKSPAQKLRKSQSKNRDGCGTKRKLTTPKQCTRKLFRILSLILQAFENNLNAELEERYVLVLEGALRDIQNAHCHLKKSTTRNLF
ncbi:PREDICTED: uncharacterized protein LOC107336864 isoform X1 [Acropora digitifera]|uniref:uncharacterized protein LOC107336864 isoform X1 n=1 Tax=Acropora digitifera TaxID=70779 RepID=UPI00077ABB03|nr:PREDICTED: uncharacterized protein LOC107336864 isoform X1 [Acropora digitifera]